MPTGNTTSKKKRTQLLYLCGGVEKNKKYKNKKKFSISTRCNYETIDLTKKHKEQKM
jgi:hypothetical protein